MKKKRKEDTVGEKEKRLKRLKSTCLRLWKEVVKLQAGGQCEVCGQKKFLNAHHIEDAKMCKALRYDPMNGIACCPSNHKWGQDAFHTSFIFILRFMEKRPLVLAYLEEHRKDEIEITEEYLVKQIEFLKELKSEME